jgi:type I restriction enzyme, S subunit
MRTLHEIKEYLAYLNQHIFKLQKFNLHPRYFYYQLRAVTWHVEDQAQRIIGLVPITKPELGTIYLPLPDKSEQEQIADYLDSQFETIDQAITRAQREIELMREYRTRLISDVVTGQVDVRGIEVPKVADEELLALVEDAAESDDVIDDELEAKIEE